MSNRGVPMFEPSTTSLDGLMRSPTLVTLSWDEEICSF